MTAPPSSADLFDSRVVLRDGTVATLRVTLPADHDGLTATSRAPAGGGPAPVRCQTYEAARERARRYAARAGANVWHTPYGSLFEARSWTENTVALSKRHAMARRCTRIQQPRFSSAGVRSPRRRGKEVRN